MQARLGRRQESLLLPILWELGREESRIENSRQEESAVRNSVEEAPFQLRTDDRTHRYQPISLVTCSLFAGLP